MADKAVNGTLNIKNLLGTDVLYVARLSTGTDCYITASDLIASLSTRPLGHIICNYNQDTNILLATAAQVSGNKIMSVTLHCYFQRNGKSRSEIVVISYTNGQSTLSENGMVTIPDSEPDLGINLSIDNSLGLNLVVEADSNPYNIDFYYNIISIISL